MSHEFEIQKRIGDWAKRHGRHPAVVRWLQDNPPPEAWEGSRLGWAYFEMPIFPAWCPAWLVRLFGGVRI